MSYVSKDTVSRALMQLYGSAGHLLKIWFVLKHMGLKGGAPALAIDTANSTESLIRLFAFGDGKGRFFVPFGHTRRFVVMESDAARSIVQTNVQRWASSGSVVTCDPTGYLDIHNDDQRGLLVSCGRNYPLGLGCGESGFALSDGKRVSVPLAAFAVWFGRRTAIPSHQDPERFLVDDMLASLRIDPSEREAVFIDRSLVVSVTDAPLTDQDLVDLCTSYVSGAAGPPTVEVVDEGFLQYNRRLRSMSSTFDLPAWLRSDPSAEVRDLIKRDARALILYGPPRTGKSRLLDVICPRTESRRATIQIHEGWGYDQLVEGLLPDGAGNWEWRAGALKAAIDAGKKFIVLEEINRTAFTQALGEVFSLLESAYRGVDHAVTLRSGKLFSIPADVTFVMTMNTVDKSTEEVDDALLGRVAAVEFPPRPEDLALMLDANGVPAVRRAELAVLYSRILEVYPLGHGYFADLKGDVDWPAIALYYKTRIRFVLGNFLGELKQAELSVIDNVVDEYVARP